MFLDIHTCDIKCHDNEDSVDSSLAMTPAQMSRLTSQGRAVSLASLENVSYYGNEIDVRDMPLEYTRGIDMNTLWQESRRSDKKVKDFIRSTKNTRSDGEQMKGGA